MSTIIEQEESKKMKKGIISILNSLIVLTLLTLILQIGSIQARAAGKEIVILTHSSVSLLR